jgi:hypothetical protein
MRGLQGERGTSAKEGFFGTIIFKNEINTAYTYDYNLKYKNNSITTGRFTNALQSINYNIEEDSNDRLLRPYYEYNVEYFINSVSLQNIIFSISGGKYRRPDNTNIFYFTPNNNCINEGTLILRSIPVQSETGWYGYFIFAIEGVYGTGVIVNVFVMNTNPIKYIYNYEALGATTYSSYLEEESRLVNNSSQIRFEIQNDGSTSINSVSITGGGTMSYDNYGYNITPNNYSLDPITISVSLTKN